MHKNSIRVEPDLPSEGGGAGTPDYVPHGLPAAILVTSHMHAGTHMHADTHTHARTHCGCTSTPPHPSFQIPERLKLTLELLKKELAVATLQQRLGKEVQYIHTVRNIAHSS